MHSKRYQILRKSMIAAISFISGIVLTIVAAAAYDASVTERATKMLTAIQSNASELQPEDAVAYYALVRQNISTLIDVLTEVDNGLVALSGDENFIPLPNNGGTTDPREGGTTPLPTGTVCTGTYPKDDPNAVLMPNGGFVVGPSATDQTNKVWKYKYAGTCTFDCNQGYTYNATKNLCEKGTTFISSECILDMSTKNNCDTSIVLKKENHIACYEVLSHPLNTPANPNKVALNTCSQASNWGPQKIANTSAWDISYDAASNKWTSKVKYGDGSLWGAAGIKARWHMKDTITGKDSTYDITVVAGNGGATAPNPYRYIWNCGFTNVSTQPTAVCGANTLGSVAKDSQGANCTCTDTQPNTPAPTQPAPTQPAPTQPAPTQPAPTQPSQVVCSGNVPSANVVKVTMPSFQGVGDWNNTIWKYDYSGSCSWKCAKGYVPNATKTACNPPAPGTGIGVTVVDKNGTPVPGVDITLTYNQYNNEVGWSTNTSGYVELFPEAAYPSAVMTLNKQGYIIFSAVGCSSRSGVATTLGGQPYSYCDGTSLSPGTKINIVMTPIPSNFTNFSFTNKDGVFYMNDINNHIINTQISGVAQNDALTCMEILAHPNFPNLVNTGHCSSDSNYVPFNGNNEWTWSAENGGTWKGVIQYTDAIYGAPGIKVRIFMKNKVTNQVSSFNISVYKS